MSRDLQEKVQQLNRMSGDDFGTKLYTITSIVSIVFAFLLIGIIYLVKEADRNTPFILDSDKKFIIYRYYPNNENIYYEIDFDKNIVVKRKDYDDNLKREKIKEIRLDSDKLEKIVNNIVNDKSNLIFPEEEEKKLINKVMKDNILAAYKIQNFENEYYVKSYDITKSIYEIFEE